LIVKQHKIVHQNLKVLCMTTYQHFTKIKVDHENDKAKCNYCNNWVLKFNNLFS
jgi:hypothetical protein